MPVETSSDHEDEAEDSDSTKDEGEDEGVNKGDDGHFGNDDESIGSMFASDGDSDKEEAGPTTSLDSLNYDKKADINKAPDVQVIHRC